MNVIYIAISAFVGGIVASLLGWLDSAEAFEMRKFGASLVRAVVAAAVFTVGYTFSNGITPMDVAVAFCGGAGVDVLGNRISGAIKARIGK